jgi:WD40 repeat protein
MKSKYSNTSKNIENIKKNKNQSKKYDISNPNNIIPFKNINPTENEFISLFDFVHTYNDIYYIIYTNNWSEIVFFDIIDNKRVLTIKKAHHYDILHIKHYFDKNNLRDLLASYSYENSIKLWNINTMECIVVIDILSSFDDEDIILNSLFFMNLKNQINIVAPFVFKRNCEKIAFYDLKGIKMKEITFKIKNHNVFDTNYYYDQKGKKNYIVFGGDGYLKSFDVNKNDIYKIYCNNDNIINNQIIIYDKDKKIKLISSGGGLVRIWNFHSGDLLNQLKINHRIYDLPVICIWNSDYLIGACGFYGLKIFDLKNEKIPQAMSGFGTCFCAKKIIHPIYGESLLVLSRANNIRYLCIAINKK